MPDSICSRCSHYVYGANRSMCPGCRFDIIAKGVASEYDSREVRNFKNELIKKIWEENLDIDQIISILED